MAIHDKKPLAIKPRVFISYSRKDGEAFAKNLRANLEAKNIPLWQDRVGMEGGRDWWLQIVEALDMVGFMVLVMTPKAMESDIIRKEWRYARQKGVCVYPVKGAADAQLDYTSLPRWMRSTQFYDLEFEWDKFINDLNTRCQESRVPFMVDDLPENFVQRPKEFNALIDQLLDVEREEPIAIATALRGAGGFGKTTLAMALCHDERVQEAYDDGILWVTLGEQPGDLTEKIKNLIEILSGERPGFTDKDTAGTHLSELVADRDILIVIDDAWDNSHVQPFLRGGPRCSYLITTRDSDTLPVGSKQNILDAMQANEAQSLLGYELPTTEKVELQKLAQRLGKWPLVLKLANAHLAERVVNRGQNLSSAIAYANKKYDKYGITAFDVRYAKDRHKAVEATISISLEILDEKENQRFAELAIFPEDIDIPLVTVEKLWKHAYFEDIETEDLCELLFRLSLLQHFDPNTREIRLHDVIRKYLRKKYKDQLADMNDRFLMAFGIDNWTDLPLNETYLWKHLSYHLIQCSESETKVYRMLLANFERIDSNESKNIDKIVKQKRLFKAATWTHDEATQSIEPEYGLHFEQQPRSCKIDETDRFYLYKVLPTDPKIKTLKDIGPILIIPSFVLGANILAFLPTESLSYVHSFANHGIPTYIRILKDINTTVAVQHMTAEEDILDIRCFCKKLAAIHHHPVCLNGICQGGYMAILAVLSGKLDGLVNLLITCAAPMDGTLSSALLEYLKYIDPTSRKRGYEVKTLSNQNKVADGRFLSWIYQLRSVESKYRLNLFSQGLNLFAEQISDSYHPFRISKTHAAINFWLSQERYDIPLAIADIFHKSNTIPVSSHGKLPIALFGRQLCFKDMNLDISILICYAEDDQIVSKESALIPNKFIDAEITSFPGEHIAIATKWAHPESDYALHKNFRNGLRGPVRFLLDKCKNNL
jgi:hypothetical protein